MLLVYILLLLVSFYLLMKICDEYFVGSLDQIAKRLKLSHEAAGATLMAVGSSAPELFVSLIALLKPGGHGAMGAGTIVGSAIFNILVIIGASLMVRKAHIMWQPVVRDMVFYCLAILMLLFSFSDGTVDLFEAGTFVALYAVYVYAAIHWKKILKYDDRVYEHVEEESRKGQRRILGPIADGIDRVLALTFPSEKHFYWIFALSIAWITGLSWILVESGVGLAHVLGIPEVIIGLTILAAGTSIPDLISSVVVAKQGRADMAISNAVGSNIFDILFGLGFPWVLTILIYGGHVAVDTTNLSSSIVLLFATVICICFLFVMQRMRLGRKSGLFLVLLYVAYLVWLITDLYF